MSPRTPSSSAIRRVESRISSIISLVSEYGGIEHALSPEWTPACSMCSMIPPITTRSPSQIASTSTSVASARKRSTRIGWSGDAFTARAMYSCSEASSCTISIARPPSTYDGRTSTG
jgi:hypothetical protein